MEETYFFHEAIVIFTLKHWTCKQKYNWKVFIFCPSSWYFTYSSIFKLFHIFSSFFHFKHKKPIASRKPAGLGSIPFFQFNSNSFTFNSNSNSNSNSFGMKNSNSNSNSFLSIPIPIPFYQFLFKAELNPTDNLLWLKITNIRIMQ